MRTFDIDLTIKIRCVAHNMEEAREVVLENFREGKYLDADKDWLEMNIKDAE